LRGKIHGVRRQFCKLPGQTRIDAQVAERIPVHLHEPGFDLNLLLKPVGECGCRDDNEKICRKKKTDRALESSVFHGPNVRVTREKKSRQ
jgi:hypothetical protein